MDEVRAATLHLRHLFKGRLFRKFLHAGLRRPGVMNDRLFL